MVAVKEAAAWPSPPRSTCTVEAAGSSEPRRAPTRAAVASHGKKTVAIGKYALLWNVLMGVLCPTSYAIMMLAS